MGVKNISNFKNHLFLARRFGDEDKETRAIRALGVSPLSMLELTLARGLFALLLNLVLVFASMAILVGEQINYALLCWLLSCFR